MCVVRMMVTQLLLPKKNFVESSVFEFVRPTRRIITVFQTAHSVVLSKKEFSSPFFRKKAVAYVGSARTYVRRRLVATHTSSRKAIHMKEL
jgi:hypothetical protein